MRRTDLLRLAPSHPLSADALWWREGAHFTLGQMQATDFPLVCTTFFSPLRLGSVPLGCMFKAAGLLFLKTNGTQSSGAEVGHLARLVLGQVAQQLPESHGHHS